MEQVNKQANKQHFVTQLDNCFKQKQKDKTFARVEMWQGCVLA